MGITHKQHQAAGRTYLNQPRCRWLVEAATIQEVVVKSTSSCGVPYHCPAQASVLSLTARRAKAVSSASCAQHLQPIAPIIQIRAQRMNTHTEIFISCGSIFLLELFTEVEETHFKRTSRCFRGARLFDVHGVSFSAAFLYPENTFSDDKQTQVATTKTMIMAFQVPWGGMFTRSELRVSRFSASRF